MAFSAFFFLHLFVNIIYIIITVVIVINWTGVGESELRVPGSLTTGNSWAQAEKTMSVRLSSGSPSTGRFMTGWFVWQSWPGARVIQSPDSDSSHGDMECPFAEGKRAWASAGGGAVSTKDSWARLPVQSGTHLLERDWTRFYSCPQWEAASCQQKIRLDNVWIKSFMSSTFCDSNYIYLVAILIYIILIRYSLISSSSYTLYAHLEY